MSEHDSLTEVLASGFLAGILGGQAFLLVGLVRYSDSLFSWALPTSLTIWIVVRSIALYGLLAGFAAVLGTTLLVPLCARFTRLRGLVFPVVFGTTVATTALVYLLAWRQIELLPGVPLSSPIRMSYAVIDAAYALLVGVLAFGLTMVMRALGGRVSKTERAWISRERIAGATLLACLVVLFASGMALRLRGPETESSRARPRVVVLGFDAATLRVMGPMMRAGELPAFQRFVEEGAWGPFLTYGATASPIIWTSMATGKKAADHGIYDWVRAKPGAPGVEPLKSYDRQVKAIWSILSESGQRVGVIDWLLTFPPEEVDGYIVSRLQLEEEHRAFPPELDAVVNAVVASGPRNGGASPQAEFWQGIDRTFDLAERMLEIYDVDALFIFENDTDAVQHNYWKCLEPEQFDPDLWQITSEGVAQYGGLIQEVYRHLDQRLGQFIQQLDDDTLIIVVSDHGARAASAPAVWFRLDHFLSVLGLSAATDDGMDFANTTAYAYGNSIWGPTIDVNLNLKGRESQGTVDPGNADAVAQTVAARLRSITLTNGRRLLGPVTVGRISSETSASGGADITIQHSEFTKTAAGLEGHRVSIDGRSYPLEEFLSWSPEQSGVHDRMGVFFALGKGVRRGYVGRRAAPTALQDIWEHLTDKVRLADTVMPQLSWLGLIPRATTLDVTPTVLYALGLPIARDMAGRPLTDIIKNGNPTWIDSYEDGTQIVTGRETDESDAELLRRLRSLGYIQ